MKVRYIAGVSALLKLTLIIFALKSFTGPSAKMDVNTLAETQNVTSTPSSTKTSHSALVVGIVFFTLCLVWHVVSFIVWKSHAAKRYRNTLLSNTDTWINDNMPPRMRYFRDYGNSTCSDDEESLVGSDIPRTQNCVKLGIKLYILWLYLPIFIIWSKQFVPKAQGVGPRGLQNLGNTCYFNSVMQTLTHTYTLQRSIQDNIYNGAFSKHFERFCKWASDRRLGPNSSCNLWNLLCATIDQFKKPREMRRMFYSRALRFSDYRQHDSHECLRHLLDELRKDERDFRKQSLLSLTDERKSLTVVDKVFGGHFITVYICKECGSPYHLFEPFLDISLPICLGSINSDQMEMGGAVAQNPQLNQEYASAAAKIMMRLSDPLTYKSQFSESQYKINDCLCYFTRIEHIQDEYLCNPCYSKHVENVGSGERLTSATKQTLIFNPPAVLTIHLKRFELKPGRSEKRNDRIRYEELLDIAPYCSKSCLRNNPPGQKIWYSLYGIIVHSGSLEFGHYIAYIKVRHNEPDIKKFIQEEYFDRDKTMDELIEMMKKKQIGRPEHRWNAQANEGIWYCMNDNRVSEVTVGEVLNQEAYLLLYERI